MRISDLITAFIREMMEESDGVIELQRNELASRFNCVPSQINYVIDTRFNPEQGFFVESQRGGGGYIRITRIRRDNQAAIMHIVNSLRDSVDAHSAGIFLENMLSDGLINETEARLINAAVSQKAYLSVPKEYAGRLRAQIFKNMLLNLTSTREGS